MRTPEEILNTLSAERQKLLDDVLKKIEAAQEARFQGEPIKVSLSLDRSEYASIQVKLTDALKLKRWQILKVETFESQRDTVTTLTIGAIPPVR
jgi:hypothetical protein